MTMEAPRTTRSWSALWRWAGMDAVGPYQETLLLVVTLLIGATVGLVVVAFILVTEGLGARLFAPGRPGWVRLAIPCVGALVSGVLLAFVFPDARGSGIPQTKTALFLHRGYISTRTVIGKFLCSSMSLASGIALGREGPTVHLGAGIASVLGRRLGLGPRRIQSLVPVGTAAAVAAAFNTPISGVLFTLEEVLGDLHAPMVGSVVLSSATSWAVLHLVLGDEPLFHVPAYQLVHPGELPIYALLGVVGGFVSAAFVALLLRLRRLFLALPATTKWIHPLGGGLVVGALGWMLPAVMGVGYQHVGAALNGELLLGSMLVLLVLKIVATSSCYASGNAGGIFGPSLFIGAMLGGSVGALAHGWMPDITGSAGAYALVGMGTAFAGIVRAPMTSVIMIFELTRDYSIIVPLMIANLLSYFIATRVQPRPVYEALLHQEGISLPPPRSASQGTIVEQVMDLSPLCLSASASVGDVRTTIGDEARPDDAWPVLDGQRLVGMLSRDAVERAAGEGNTSRPVGELVAPGMVGSTPSVHPDDPLDMALLRMGSARVGILPVVSRTDPGLLVGTVSLTDLPEAYTRIARGPGAHDAAHHVSPKTLLTVVVGGVVGLFLLGTLLTQHYYRVRTDTAARHYAAGQALVSQQRDADAVEQFRAAVSLVGRDDYRIALGLALARAGRTLEARTYLAEVVARAPRNGAVHLALARMARGEGRVDAAIAEYREALVSTWPTDDDPERIQAAFELVDVLSSTGQVALAITRLQQIAVQAGEPATLERVGRRLLEMRAAHEAADVYGRMVTLAPLDAASHAGMGEAAFAQHQYEAARAAFAKAVALDGSDVQSRARLALCEQVLSLDPSQRVRSRRERVSRTHRLLGATLAALDRCQPQEAAAEDTEQLAIARSLVAAGRSRPLTDDQAEEALDLATSLWEHAAANCPIGADDEALARVFARLRGPA